MSIYTIPFELLPAFCQNPYTLNALRLTCGLFYSAISPPNDVFKKVGARTWASDFWIIASKCADGAVYTEEFYIPRVCTGNPTTMLATATPKITTGGMTKRTDTRWIWRGPDATSVFPTTRGIEFVEDPKNIFIPVEKLRAGNENIQMVIKGVNSTLELDTLVIFYGPIKFNSRDVDTFFVNSRYAQVFAGCEHDCMVYRRKDCMK